MKIPYTSLRAPVALGALTVLFACSENPDSVMQPFAGGPSFHIVPVANPEVELLVICKVGPPGTYTFNATATQPVLRNLTTGAFDQTSGTFTLTVSAASTLAVGSSILQGACTQFTNTLGTHNHVAVASGSTQVSVTVVESNIPTGLQFVKVDTYQKTGGQSGPVAVTSSTSNTATVQLGGSGTPASLMGGNMVFFNEPEEDEFAGCTPGFWKQEQHFQYWTAPYAPSTVIQSVFASAAGYTTSKGVAVGTSTLLQGLSFGGGPGVGDAAAILLRAAIAGLLNAASPDVNYYTTVANLINTVNAALASGDRNTMLGLATTIDDENNRGCTAKD